MSSYDDFELKPTPSPAASPRPTTATPDDTFPICTRCGADVEHIKYMDYETIRVVYHDPMGCVLGVLNN